MAFVEETTTTSDGLRLYTRLHRVEKPRAEIIIVHGFGEHSGRYSDLTEHLLGHSYSVTLYDQRGHGLSAGLQGHVESFDLYEDDLGRVYDSVRSRNGSSQICIIAHSMGGLVTLRYVATRNSRLAGAIISAPLIAMAASVPAHKLVVAKIGARIAPRIRLGNEINPAHLSRDPEVGIAYAADPLVHRLVSAGWFAETKRAMEEVVKWAPQISLPLLVMHGTNDRLACVKATERVFEKIGSADKELRIYPGFYHELFNEPDKRQLFDRLTKWLKART